MQNEPISTSTFLELTAKAVIENDEFTTSAFMLTSSLVARVGDTTAATLLAHTARYHEAYIAPFLAQGFRLSMQFDRVFFGKWIRNKRAGPDGKVEGVGETDGFTTAICYFAWKMETALWGAGAVCLRGLGPRDRDEVYVDVLRILELRWKVQDELPRGSRDAGCGAYADRALSEKWCRGLLPDEETAESASHRMMGTTWEARAGAGTSLCILECRCDDERVAVYLSALRPAPEPGLRSEEPARQGRIFAVQGLMRW